MPLGDFVQIHVMVFEMSISGAQTDQHCDQYFIVFIQLYGQEVKLSSRSFLCLLSRLALCTEALAISV